MPASSAIQDHRVVTLLDELHDRAARQERWLPLRFLDQLPRLLLRRGLDWGSVGARLSDQFIALDRDQGNFCYLLLRALHARSVVEFGTSFGISTLYLAAAVRDNGGGRVVASEIVPEKAETALAHLRRAGLEAEVELRVGDARRTLARLDEPVDFVLLDGFPPATLPVLQALLPALRPGSLVFADNVGAFPADHRDYLEWVRTPAHGFASARLALNEGSELSVYLGAGGR